MTYEVSDLAFEADGTALITFMERTDVRCGGAVAIRQTLRVVPTEQYAEGIQEVMTAVQRLLTDAHDDWRLSEPVQLDDMDPGTGVPDDTGDEVDDLETPARRSQWEAIEASKAQHAAP